MALHAGIDVALERGGDRGAGLTSRVDGEARTDPTSEVRLAPKLALVASEKAVLASAHDAEDSIARERRLEEPGSDSDHAARGCAAQARNLGVSCVDGRGHQLGVRDIALKYSRELLARGGVVR